MYGAREEESVREVGKGLSSSQFKRLAALIDEARRQPDAWPFLKPVDRKVTPLTMLNWC